MSDWRPYEPQRPEFRYRVVKRDPFRDCEKYEVLANGHAIGFVYSKHMLYYLSPSALKPRTLEAASEKLWERFTSLAGRC